jgi:hypothetical protein
MFGGYSVKEVLLWVGGMAVAAVITILAVIWATDTLDPRDPADPLTKAGGLEADTPGK